VRSEGKAQGFGEGPQAQAVWLLQVVAEVPEVVEEEGGVDAKALSLRLGR